MTTFPERLRTLHTQGRERTALTLQFSHAGDLHITVDDLLRGSSAFSRAFALAEIMPGEVVILILQHGENLVYSFWGAILHGAIPSIMPFLTEKLSPERYRADLDALISVTQPAAIVTYADFETEVRSALKEGDSVRAVIVAEQVAGKSGGHSGAKPMVPLPASTPRPGP